MKVFVIFLVLIVGVSGISSSYAFSNELLIFAGDEVRKIYYDGKNVTSAIFVPSTAGAIFETGYDATLEIKAPKVYKNEPDCTDDACELAIWTGLTDASGAENTGLAQAGGSSRIFCDASSCAESYFIWYEFLPDAAVFCSGAVNAGDSITATVTNDHIDSGNSDQYDISVVDHNTGTSCTITDEEYNEIGDPKYAPFINERPTSGGFLPLPEFSSDTMTGTVYYSQSSKSIYTPWDDGYYTEFRMYNPDDDGVQNISVGNVNTGGSFTQTWLTSEGT